MSVYYTVHRLYINILCQQSLEALEPDTFSYHLKCIKPIVHDVLLGQSEFLVSVDDFFILTAEVSTRKICRPGAAAQMQMRSPSE